MGVLKPSTKDADTWLKVGEHEIYGRRCLRVGLEGRRLGKLGGH
jgi:hypothetical protein